MGRWTLFCLVGLFLSRTMHLLVGSGMVSICGGGFPNNSLEAYPLWSGRLRFGRSHALRAIRLAARNGGVPPVALALTGLAASLRLRCCLGWFVVLAEEEDGNRNGELE